MLNRHGLVDDAHVTATQLLQDAIVRDNFNEVLLDGGSFQVGSD
jgi:hypothetical protein